MSNYSWSEILFYTEQFDTNYVKFVTIFQNLTPVELKIAKNETLTFLTITRELDVSAMSNYTFSEYISNNFGQIWPN